MIRLEHGQYTLTDNQQKAGEFSYVLLRRDKQVCWMTGTLSHIENVRCEPPNCGLGIVFLEMIVEAAKNEGKRRVEVVGEIPANLKHALTDKLGFKYLGHGTWEKNF